MDLIRNVKGIKKLEINDDDFNKLNEKRVVGIYGPNGSGKSSFKLGISTVGEVPKKWRHFDLKNQKSFVKEEMKVGENVAIFDENLVNLIRNKREDGIWFFGEKIKTLYQLLVNQEKILENNSKIEEFWETISSIKTKEVAVIVKNIDKLAYILEKIETKKTDEYKYDFNIEISRYFKDTFNSIFKDLAKHNLFYDKEANKMLNSSFNTNNLNLLLTKIENREEIKTEEILNSINELKSIKEIFLDIIYIVDNFGYVDYGNKFENIIEKSNLINRIDYDVNLIGFQLNKFIDFLNHENINQIKMVWDQIRKKVSKVLKISNNLLQTYGLRYRVNIEPTTIYNDSNFGLKYISLNNNIDSKIEKKDIDTFLSYGELNIISLTLFLSAALLRNNLNDSIFIFDDPISSYDLNKVQTTISIIRKLIFDRNEIKKIYFLSHEKHFIKKIKFPFKKNISTFKLSTGNPSMLNYKNKMETDFDFYNSLLSSKDKITEAIAKRYFSSIYSEVKKPNKDFSFYSKVIHYTPEEKIENIDFENSDILKKEELISFRNKIQIIFSDYFWTWINEKSNKILDKILENDNPVADEEYLILQCNTYQDTLNSIAHEEENGANLDISRVDEIIDILYESRKHLLECFKVATTMFQKEVAFKKHKLEQSMKNEKYKNLISDFLNDETKA